MKRKNLWEKQIESQAVLNPSDRISEVLFGLIMVLTFTGAIRASNGSDQEVRELLWAALGCNLAWGFVDAIMFLMNVLTNRGHGLKVIERLSSEHNETEKLKLFKAELPPLMTENMTDKETGALLDRLLKHPKPGKNMLLGLKDFISAGQIFLLVFLCTFPVAIPFLLINDPTEAIRVSNGIAILMLLGGGIQLGRYAGFTPLLTGIVYTLIGIFLVVVTMLLGG